MKHIGDFDEFGNPIGDISSSDESCEDDNEYFNSKLEPKRKPVILQEDKQYYLEANKIYQAYTKIKYEDEDRDEYTKPIIEEEKRKKIAIDLNEVPKTNYSKEFLKNLMGNHPSMRNIAFVGAIGHGKTEFIDCLVTETHPNIREKVITKVDITNQVVGEGRRLDRLGWTDRTFLEKRRQLSVGTEAVTLCDTDLTGKTYALTLVDTPGHPDFLDQVVAGLSLVDGVVFCVDAIEGLTSVGKRLISTIAKEKLPLILAITKIDRLILESKFPQQFAFNKLLYVIAQINTALKKERYEHQLSPELGNVIFSSARFNLCFSALSIGLMYMRKMPLAEAFAQRFWGDFRVKDGKIISSHSDDLKHPFIYYALDPLYKAISAILSMEPKEWSDRLKVPLSGKEAKMNTAPLLRIGLSRIFGSFAPFITAVARNLPEPADRSVCGIPNPLSCRIAKFSPSTDGSSVRALCRIFRGTICPGMTVSALFQSFAEDKSQRMDITINQISLTHCRYYTPIEEASEGSVVLLDIEPDVQGICVLTDRGAAESPLPALEIPPALMRIAIEPLRPKELDMMVKAVDMARLCYPALKSVRIKATGEYTLMGTGELFMDCVLHDIRTVFGRDLEVKVSDPFVVFAETVSDKSVTICYADIDDHSSIGITAEPAMSHVMYDLDHGVLGFADDLGEALQKDGWDVLATEGAWALGPDRFYGANILVDETFEPKNPAIAQIRPILENAFRWATSEGPLCEEPIRGVVFRIVDFKNDSAPVPRMPGILMPAMRRALFASFLAANPKLMEPICFVEVMVTTESATSIVEAIITNRRGVVEKRKTQMQGTQLTLIRGIIPMIDSFGLETSIRARTGGVAFPMMWFQEWRTVPGNPLDGSLKLRPLEPAPDDFLGRDFTVKTRHRKDLPENIDLSKYCSPDLLVDIATLMGN